MEATTITREILTE